jgi:tRNA threonylcarbamoyladenosine biosynthesis protein TsaB
MSTTLAFDTSLSATSVAIFHNGQVFHAQETTQGSQAANLLPMIESVLAEANIAYADVSRLVVTIGPGSFTGLRIGLATAHGILAVYPIKSCAISTLEAIAYTAAMEKPDGEYWATLNAGKGEIAAQLFRIQNGIPSPVSEILKLTPAELPQHLREGQHVLENLIPHARAFVSGELPHTDPSQLMPHYIRDADAKPATLLS